MHALKPSSLTLVTVIGLNIGRLIGGAVITESIFALPGVGRLIVESIYARDLVMLQGVVLLVAVAFVFINFTVDMLYAVLRTAHSLWSRLTSSRPMSPPRRSAAAASVPCSGSRWHGSPP